MIAGIAAGQQAGGPLAPSPRLSFAVGRASGAVVVTVHGEVDEKSSGLLQQVLTDLVEGQGNLRVAVDLGDAHIVDSHALTFFRRLTERARRRGAQFSLFGSPPLGDRAPESGGPAEVTGPA